MSFNPKSRTPLIDSKFVRSAFSRVSRVSMQFDKVSRFTRQEFRDECDINTIMRRYQSTGELPVLNQGSAKFLDVSASLTFQDSMNFVASAQSMFNELLALSVIVSITILLSFLIFAVIPLIVGACPDGLTHS